LTPYLDGVNGANHIGNALATLKVKEAAMILLETNPALKDILFDVSEPGKIDLEAYMNEHYKFNVDLNRFAYLTGRSLATFKRDFEKTFLIFPLHSKRHSVWCPHRYPPCNEAGPACGPGLQFRLLAANAARPDDR
jgi:hypothetical protein